MCKPLGHRHQGPLKPTFGQYLEPSRSDSLGKALGKCITVHGITSGKWLRTAYSIENESRTNIEKLDCDIT